MFSGSRAETEPDRGWPRLVLPLSEDPGASSSRWRDPVGQHSPRLPAPEQLADVVDGADELPLAGGRTEPAQAEAPEASGFLDLGEDRVDDGLGAGGRGGAR